MLGRTHRYTACPECEETLHSCQLDSALPNHASREEAVMGSSEYTSADGI